MAMINLLPPIAKKEIAAGRANRLLLRYLLLFIGLAVLMVAIIGFVYWFLHNTNDAEQRKKADSESSSQQLMSRQQDVAAFKADLATAKQILDKQIDYSDIILRVAGAIPAGVIISDLTLSPEVIGTPTKITAQARSESSLHAFKAILNRSSYFEEVFYDTVTKQEGDYPYSVVLTVTFKQELLDE